MALSATVHVIELELADVDRNVYETLTLRVARHPSESGPYLIARVIAYALEYSEDLAFSKGLGSADEPAVWAYDPSGQLLAWIEVGTPDPARVHKARKAADDVAVYCHKDPYAWLKSLAAAKVHARDTIRLYLLDRRFVEALAETLERRVAWSLTRSEGTLYVQAGALSLTAPLTRLPWPQAE